MAKHHLSSLPARPLPQTGGQAVTTAGHAHFTLTHGIRSRVRIFVPSLRRRSERAYALEILLRRRPEIRHVRAVPEIGAVIIHFDPKRLSREQLFALLNAIIPRLGRARPQEAAEAPESCAVPAAPTETTVAIEGMTCASCALLIELSLNRNPRVQRASVNFGAQIASVQGTLPRAEIFDLVSRLGYTARPMDTLSQRRLIVQKEKEQLAAARRRVWVAGLLTLPVMVIGMAMPRSMVFKTAEFLLSTPVVFWAGRPFFEKAVRLARQRASNMDTLIAMGAGAAYAYSVPALLLGKPHLYFEAASGIITFVLLGRYLEERAKGRASDAVRKLLDLQPPTATVIHHDGEVVVGIDDVVVGDILLVRPGEKIPTDGEVIAGVSTVDESMVTGESMPVIKEPGGKVIGGCINGAGTFRMRVTATGTDTVLSGIVRMVDEAQGQKLPVQKLADRISSVFVPAVIGTAGATFTGWMLAGGRFPRAMANAITVLLIACPCSLGLATPTAIMAATGQAARQGIFVRNAESLETAAKLTTLIFDKTGTVTEGRPAVIDFHNLSGHDETRLLRLVASAEMNSEHHLGRAILGFARARNVETVEPEAFATETGQGVGATVQGHSLLIGNAQFLADRGVAPESLEHYGSTLAMQGKTPVFVAIDGVAAAVFGIADQPRATAHAALQQLNALGIDTLMVTGDTERTARFIAERVGVHNVIAAAPPERKLAVIRELRERGAVVGMVGDGINDAPALAAADVGFAVGTGTDIAIEASHITLVNADITKVADAIQLSRKTMRIIKQNLFWALGYNTIAIPVAVLGKLNPMIASAAMAMSSVSVVTNSLRLQRSK